MHATQAMVAAHAVASSATPAGTPGEAVLVTPCHSGTVDDRLFASHASFAWRDATVVLTRREGGGLRYKTSRLIAMFSARELPRLLHSGDHITRSWNGAVFVVAGVYRDGPMLCCELIERNSLIH